MASVWDEQLPNGKKAGEVLVEISNHVANLAKSLTDSEQPRLARVEENTQNLKTSTTAVLAKLNEIRDEVRDEDAEQPITSA